MSLTEGPDLKDLIQACLFDSKYLAYCGDNHSQHIYLADSGIAKPTNNPKEVEILSMKDLQNRVSIVQSTLKVQSLLTLFVDQVCTFTPLKRIVQEDTQIFVFLYNLYSLTSDRC